ncbi:MAG: hypothetical protein HY320_05490 [Armatimonadetes bacterium]|nr:hypothetical protein [Armatimonadota bacterium]
MIKSYTALLLAAIAALLTVAATGQPAQKPPPAGLPGFLRQLGRFSSAEAKTIARQIENGPRDLKRELAACRRAGIPGSWRQLRTSPPPAAQNAAPLYQRLTQLLKERPLDQKAYSLTYSIGTRYALTEEEIGTVRRLLAERRDVMDLVHQAAARPRCDFQRDWSKGWSVIFPNYSSLRLTALLLRAESYLLAKDGRYREAVANQVRGFRIAEHAASDPILMGYLTGLECRAVTRSGLEEILYLAGPNAEVAESVRRAILAHPSRFDLRRALAGDVALALAPSTVDLLRREGPKALAELAGPPAAGSGSNSLPALRDLSPGEKRIWLQLVDACEADYLRRMRLFIINLGKPAAKRAALAKRLYPVCEKPPHNPVHSLSILLVPVLERTILPGDRTRARERVLIAAGSLLAYKARHGTFPARLAQALPRPPTDPFSGQPLQYRREGKGFVVYSVGPEGKFNGGQPGAWPVGDQTFFRYPAPPPRRPEPQTPLPPPP